MRLLFAVLVSCACTLTGCLGESFVDERDGHRYKTTTIDGQVWMAQNLNYATNDGSYCAYDKVDSCVKYGRRYTWEAALVACPAGWHLPKKSEWFSLQSKLFRDGNGDASCLRAKEWGGSDKYGFKALPTYEMTRSYHAEMGLHLYTTAVSARIPEPIKGPTSFNTTEFWAAPSPELPGEDNLGNQPSKALLSSLENSSILFTSGTDMDRPSIRCLRD